MLTIDVVALIDRINKLEAETKELRGLIKTTEAGLAEQIEEAKQSAYDAIPKSEGDKLIFESYDDQGNTVYGHVVAEIKTDEQPST